MMRKALSLLFILALAPVLSQCTTNVATGRNQFTAFMSPAQERQVGSEEHPKILAEYHGAYPDKRLQDYVTSLGKRLAVQSELPADQFTFTLLNDPLVNAFALPGGYVYVTRGLLALANSEAELAAVIGHEIGHVTARHTAERYSRANVANIGSTILGVLLGSQEATQVAQQGAQLYLLSFSRSQELEADKLGVRYLTRIGLDPFAEADFLDTLRRNTELEASINGQQLPQSDFLQTHPNTAARVKQAIAEAEGKAAAPNQSPRYPDRYLDMIGGLLYGEDPAEGVVRGQTFEHPALGFAFTAPSGYKIANTPQAVIVQADQNSGIVFDTAKVAAGTGMSQYLAQDWAKGASLAGLRQFTLNGMEAAEASARASTQNGVVDVHLVAVRFEGEKVFRFQLITPPPASDALLAGFHQLVMSLRRLSDAERAAIKPYRVDVVRVQAGDTLAKLAQRMPFTDGHNVERLMVLNGLASPTDLKAGQRLKIIVER